MITGKLGNQIHTNSKLLRRVKSFIIKAKCSNNRNYLFQSELF